MSTYTKRCLRVRHALGQRVLLLPQLYMIYGCTCTHIHVYMYMDTVLYTVAAAAVANYENAQWATHQYQLL